MRVFSVISRTIIGGVLTICRDADGVFYSPSRLGDFSKWFSLSRMALDISSLVNGDFHHKFSIGSRSGQFVGHVIDFISLSRRKAFIPLLHEKIQYPHQTNFLLMEWENYPVFRYTHVYWLIYSWVFKWHAYHEWHEKFMFSSVSHLHKFHLNIK